MNINCFYHKIILFVVCQLILNQSFSQSRTATSGNNKYFAVSAVGDTETEINIYEIATGRFLRKCEFVTKNQIGIDELMFNFDGKMLYSRKKNFYRVWDLVSGTSVIDVDSVFLVKLANINNMFVIYKKKKIIVYDTFTGRKLNIDYEIPANVDIYELQFSDNDKYLIARTNDEEIIVWKTGTKDIKLRCSALDVKFGTKGLTMTVMQRKSNNIIGLVYDLSNLNLITTINSKSIIKQERKAITDSLHLLGEYVKLSPLTILTEQSGLSPDGKYIVVASGKVKAQKELKIINTINSKLEYSICNKDFSYPVDMYPYSWNSSDQLTITTGELSKGLFDIEMKKFVKPLSYKFEFGFGEKKIPEKDLMRNSKISPDKKITIAQYYSKSNKILYIKNASAKGQKIILKDVTFLAFSPDNQYLYVKNENNDICLIRTSEIKANIEDLELLPVSKILTKIKKEKLIVKDAIPPKEYKYQTINSFRHISELTDNDILNLQLRTIDVKDSSTAIRVHLMDNHGNFIYGAGNDKWRPIWSNLLWHSPDESFHEFTDFEVTETREDSVSSRAIAIVLDHSGSMGNGRIIKLQSATKRFIKKKNKRDGCTIIKYDEKVNVDASFSKNTETLLNEFSVSGIDDYGGGTALLDAAYKALCILQNYNKFDKRAIFLFTDGLENSSMSTTKDVLDYANANNISIHTIAFGKDPNCKYLETLAYLTNGSYHHIYKTESIDWILKDVNEKMDNYYSVYLETQEIGEYEAEMVIEYTETKKDTLKIAFTNGEQNFDEFDNDITIPQFTPTHETQKDTAVIRKEFESNDFNNVRFTFYKTEIVDGTDYGLNNIVRFMRKHPLVKLEIHGHTDNIGEHRDNIKLSKLRAEKVKNKITSKGINEKRIRSKGYGESRPIASNKSEEGRQQNRRVEFKLVF